MPRRTALVIVLATAVAAVATVALVAGATAGEDRCGDHRAAARDRAELLTGSGAEVLVIGDSYSVGYGVTAADSWPVRLTGRVRVAGFSGSGFSRHASPCGDQSYAARAPGALRRDTRLVVAQGGLNDFDQPVREIEAGFRRLMRALDGHRAVVVGPVSAPARSGAVPDVDAVLARLCAEYDVPYLSLAGQVFPYLPDGLHLTADGHRQFGDVVAGWVTAVAARPAAPSRGVPGQH